MAPAAAPATQSPSLWPGAAGIAADSSASLAGASATRRRLAKEGHFDPPANDLATFRAALAAHEPAAATFRKASDDTRTSPETFRQAEARYEETQAALFHAVEELTCVPARRLLKALGG